MTDKSGIDIHNGDRDTRAQDDLFAHANGRWLAEHAIPADRSEDGPFLALRDRAEADVRAIIETVAASAAEPDSEARKIGALYASFMDTDAVAAAGLTPIAEELAAVRSATDRTALAALMGRLQRIGVRGAVAVYVINDEKDSQRYVANFMQSGLGLPDESYYREEKHAEIRTAYVEHIGRMFALAGVDDDQAVVFELERRIAAAHWDVVKRREAELGYNPTRFADLAAHNPGFPWAAWASEVAVALPGAPETRFVDVNVRQPSFVTAFAQLWESVPVAHWQSWLTWQIINARAPYLTDAFVEEDFAFFRKRLSGAPEQRERWKRGVELVEDLLGEAVGKLFVAEHFPPSAKTRMVELVENLTAAYRANITALEWMGAETKRAALVKLEKFTTKIGYPDTWRDYSGVEIAAEDLVGNYRNGFAAEHDRNLRKLGSPVDRDEWFMTPQTVNAYYNPRMNEIVFPAAILRPPFFDMEADDAANYGGIGAIIGHEIGHGFDDQGAKFDGDGNLEDWWTDGDRAEFGKRTAALVAQYEVLSPAGLPEHTVNGALTVGENIGDLGGLSIAMVAYRLALGDDPAPVLDGLTALQRVFLGWAQVWRAKVRAEAAIRRLATDPHSPPEFRCNATVRNIDAFYEAFDVQPGDALYLEPESRVRIW
ncbi:M13 family peptidase [Actinospica durhamensis]|uniref:M13 family peptidase n=1 Tax=Actinospica durhamensis TaxID=1508375 RepID=A0A941EYX4_9ACTN|nr:M13-type metalloendopeptidase [Actinospica durhamensis]MBR7836614.1 M13 family peptidase [Actinospica durhamensis]